MRTVNRVSLPMYDWPELREPLDAFHVGLHAHLVTAGFDPDAGLDRQSELMSLWQSPALLLAQTCGLPYVRHLRGRVSLVGTPEFDVPGCANGYYASALIVNAQSPVTQFESLKGARAVVNGCESQSGCVALYHPVLNRQESSPYFSQVAVSGSHRASAASVAEGSADVCAIDPVSWQLIQDWDHAVAQRLRVLAWSDAVPALPLITSIVDDSDRLAALRAAVRSTFSDPSLAQCRTTLRLAGLVNFEDADYDCVADGWQAVTDLGYVAAD